MGTAVVMTALLLWPAVLIAATAMFRAQLDPVAFDSSNRAHVIGSGTVAASLDGNTLTVSGSFSGLSSPATGAQLRTGLAMGVPGPVIAELTATSATSGSIAGRVQLNPAQLTALRSAAVYVQLLSVKAPEGSLWGWLEAS